MNKPPKQFLQTIKIIHWGMVLAPVIFSLFVYFNHYADPFPQENNLQFLTYLPGVLFVIMALVSNMVYKSVLRKQLPQAKQLIRKLQVFQSAHLVRMAMAEIAALFAAVVCFITGTLLNLLVVVGVLVVFYILRPTLFKLENELNLTIEEKRELTEKI